MFPRHTIITQHHPRNAELIGVRAENHAILIDASGGRGVSPAEWSAPETSKPVGFAGGLGPENLAKEMGKIWKIARKGWWVDMENKLRVDDWFSIELAQTCITEFETSA